MPAWARAETASCRSKVAAPRVRGVSTTKSRRPGPSVRTRVAEFRDGARLDHEDRVATEEPLEIRVSAPGLAAQRVAVTMRTPGHDFELAAGWLVHEGVATPDEVRGVRYCTDATITELEEFNVVTVDLATPPSSLPTARLVNSACGVCGTDSVQDVLAAAAPPPPVTLDLATVLALPDRLRENQPGLRQDRWPACRGALRGRTAPRSSYARTSGGTTPSTRSIGSRILAGRAGAAGAGAQWPDRLRARAEGRRVGHLRDRRRRRPDLPRALARGGRRHDPGRLHQAQPLRRVRRRRPSLD